MLKIGMFKRIKNSVFPEHEASEKKDDKRYIAVIAVFGIIILISVIKAGVEGSLSEQIRNLRFSPADGIMLLLAAGGYCILKRGGRK